MGRLLCFLAFVLTVFTVTSGQTTSNITNTTTAQDTTTEKSTTSPPVTAAPKNYSEHHYEYEGYDGWYNNLAHPDWGAADMPMMRRIPHAYHDSVYEPSGYYRPNPIEIALATMDGDTGMPSAKNRTAFLVFFGQQVVEEILDAQRPGCPVEYFNILIPKNDTRYNPNGMEGLEMPFVRSRYDQGKTGFSPNNPRQQLNEITPWIDGGLTYGVAKAWADALRAFCGGRLASTNETCDNYKLGGVRGNVSVEFPAYNDVRLPLANPPPPKDHYLKNVDRFFKLGNPRGNENPMLLTFGVLWFRYHNYWARKLQAEHPKWSDEKLFNEARKWVIAIHQKIIVYDWLPAWIGEDGTGKPFSLPEYKYDPSVNPQIAHVFQSAAMRFGHTLVPPGVYRRTKDCKFRGLDIDTKLHNHKAGLRTCNSYWNSLDPHLESNGIEEMLMGMASQITEKEDNIITSDLRGSVFGTLDFSRRDLMAVNIQRGRDHGLPDYNTARKAFRLKEITKWEDINPTVCGGDINSEGCRPIRNMRDIYHGNINDLDIWPAGLLETTINGPGELFRTIILDQFRRIRDGDRFWFENYELNGLFTKEEIDIIWNITIYDVVLRSTNIQVGDIQRNPFKWEEGDPCPQPYQLSGENRTHLEECTPVQHYDYFTGSDWSFILTFLSVGVFAVATVGVLFLLAKNHQSTVEKTRMAQRRMSRKKTSVDSGVVLAVEWVDRKEGERNVKVKFDRSKKQINVSTTGNKAIRTIDLSMTTTITFWLSSDKGLKIILIKVPKEYDLVLKFDSTGMRGEFIEALERFLNDIGIGRTTNIKKEDQIKTEAFTKLKRQKQLEKFFRTVFNHAFKIDKDGTAPTSNLTSAEANDIITCELTRTEFAEALSMKPTATFVVKMFELVDKDNNGYISFREFLDMLIIFAQGSGEEKARLLFDMYDVGGQGYLSLQDFHMMLKSMMDLANTSVEKDQIDQVVKSMLESANLHHKQQISFDDFNHLLSGHRDVLDYAQLNFQGAGVEIPQASGPPTTVKAKGRRESASVRANRTIVRAYKSKGDPSNRISTAPFQVETLKREQPATKKQKRLYAILGWMENHTMHIFWVSLYTLVLLGVFIERAYFYSIEREHRGLRRIAGYGVTVTRGAASAMMFTYASMLVTMCRNLITFLRETFLHTYIPFDSYIWMHKYVAFWALFFTVMHTIGHSINFYHISTQTPGDLTCYFRDFFRSTHQLPTFTYWCWTTMTGFTGVLLVLIVILMYTFAMQYSRRHCFQAFWRTHNLYIFLYILMFMHGSGRLVQPPFTYYFVTGPFILFVLDRLVSVSRNKVEIPVIKGEALPSDVTFLEFKRPLGFEYKSGQWVRIASIQQNESEYHPFTLTSAPHEENLSLHIRAVGPWTMNLREMFKNVGDFAYPKLYLDGPFGEGHQDWYKYDVAVLVGGGIGVTPFASILKDIVHRSSIGSKFTCKKVYFLWVTRTQKHYEWLTDIIKEVEEKDVKDLVSVHIFITQFYQKFDLRTTMLYICERHFQKISNRSLFTGLRSITHFGRPQFKKFLGSLRDIHHETKKIGVFSCGPPAMTKNVEEGCTELNKDQEAVFIHHFENF